MAIRQNSGDTVNEFCQKLKNSLDNRCIKHVKMIAYYTTSGSHSTPYLVEQGDKAKQW
jgi:hypothetical protein